MQHLICFKLRQAKLLHALQISQSPAFVSSSPSLSLSPLPLCASTSSNPLTSTSQNPCAHTMSVNIPINQVDPTAPTPQNTPLTHAPIAQGLSRPTVPDITEDNEPDEDEPEAGAIQKAMLGLVHGKLSGLVGKSSGYIESLPVEVKKNIEALKGVQVKQVELQNQYKRECLELEKKVRRRYPIFCLRCVCGERGVAMEVIESREEGDPRTISLYEEQGNDRRIPCVLGDLRVRRVVSRGRVLGHDGIAG